MARLVVFCALLPLAAFPGAASAGSVTGAKASAQLEDLLRFTADPGETNRLTVQREAPGSTFYDVSDAFAPLRASGTCVSTGPGSARCDLGVTDSAILIADLGDADDSVTVGAGFGPGTEIAAGAGDDTISGACQVNGQDGNDTIMLCDDRWAYADGGPGDDVIHAGAGNDNLHGGAGHDRLIGGSGDDLLSDDDVGSGDSDTLEGGGGIDTLSYGTHTRGVMVNLATQRSPGLPGENDTISGIENVTGGRGNDTLVGDGGPNQVDGGPGADLLSGGGGPDVLDGGPGADTLDGGDGDDVMAARDLYRDRVTCGSGVNGVFVEPGDVLAPDCGTPQRAHPRLLFQKRLVERRNGTVAVQLGCFEELGPPALDLDFECSGTVTIDLRLGRTWVRGGRSSCRLDGGCGGRFVIRLSRATRRALERAVHLPGRISYTPLGGRQAGALTERKRLPARRARP